MNILTKNNLRLLAVGLLAAAVACGDDDEDPTDGGADELEIITTINISLTSGTQTITGQWQDLDGDGAGQPVIMNPGALTLGSTYAMSIEILNESEDPADDITLEIQEEAEEHQFFFAQTGDVITVPMSDDVESDYAMNMVGDDLPVGLASTFTATAAGSGTLNIVLKHLPPINDNPQKTGTNTVNDGETDFDITFDVTVQ